ncbi:hypothetical protein J6S35_00985 [Candidatus Saccharibacteria bacterium]|nr:hypothetical protein [Candidatus Saccharibacteria bacterium]
MKTKVRSVLVLPDDPCLSEPVPISIRTENGDLMRKRLEKLIEDDKVVFISEDIIAELQDDLDQEFQKISEETGELIWVICKDSLEMLYYIQNGMTDGDTENSVAERITTVRVCIACRRLLHKSVSEIKNLAIFRRYRKLEAECAKLMEENRRLEAEQASLMKSLASDY